VLVAHQLEFVFLPPEDRLLKQHLGRGRIVQASPADAAQVLLVVGDARAQAAHREGGAHHDRVRQVLRGGDELVHRVTNVGACAFRAAPLHDTLEQLTVLAQVDGFQAGADEFHVVALKNASLGHGDRGIQCGLPAKGGEQRIGAFFLDDALDDIG